MEVRHAIAQADDRERISNQAVSIKRAQHLPAGMRGHHEHRRGLHFQVLLPPDRALQLHTAVVLFERLALAHLDVSAHFRACAFTSSLIRGFPSAFFVASQRASISSRGRSLNARPDSSASASIARKRRENLALALLSAISGSTCKNRARFIAANSKSPISSSIPI